MSLPPRASIGPYEIVALLGSGATGEVYLARDSRLGRNVALKILTDEASSPAGRSRFVREARTASSLTHPDIATVYEIGSADGRDYISFEYVEGRSLGQNIPSGGFAVDDLVTFGEALAEALAYAHQHGIVHRDIKPSNVMITKQGRPKVLDFGIAKLAPGSPEVGPTFTRLTGEGSLIGTVGYMSPEQVLGKEVDARTDVFALGCLLFEMAAGRPAFSGETATQVLDQALHAEPAPLGRIRPDLPPELVQIVSKAMRKDPTERYQHAEEIAADLRHLKRGRATESTAGSTVAAAPRPHPAWRTAVATAAAAVLVVIAGLLLWRGWASPASVDAPGARSLAVMYFENLNERSDPERLGSMLTSLLATELSGAEGLQVVSNQRLYDVGKQLGRADGSVDRSIATEVAKRVGVGTMVIGSIAQSDGKLVAIAELVDVSSGASLAAPRAEATTTSEIFRMAETLGSQVRRAAGVKTRAADDADLARTLTSSVEAYRAFVQGEQFFHRWEFEPAAERFHEAIELDSQFGLAEFWLSRATGWLGRDDEADAAAQRSIALIEKFPRGFRDIVQANALYIREAYSKALPLLTTILDADPHNKEALYMSSEIYVHSQTQCDPVRAAALMERLLDQDPDYHVVYGHLALVYNMLGTPDKYRDRLLRWEKIDPDRGRQIRADDAALRGRPAEALRLSQGLAGIVVPMLRAQWAMIADDWALARTIVNEDPVARGLGGDLLSAMLATRGDFHVYRGEMPQAVAAYATAAGVHNRQASGEGYTAGTIARASQSAAELSFAQGRLREAQQRAEQALRLTPQSPRSLYYAGLYALRNQDAPAAERHRNSLHDVVKQFQTVSGKLYQDALDAELALAQGRAVEAQRIFEGVVGSGALLYDWLTAASASGAAFRDGLVRASIAAGDRRKAREALRALVGSGDERIGHPVLYVRGMYSLGALDLDAGDIAAGREHLQRFLDHWGRLDLPEVRDARARLARVGR